MAVLVAGRGVPDRDVVVSPDILPINVIDGVDDRDSLLTIGPALGLSPEEMARIRKVSGFVGCFRPTPSVGSGALFLSNRQIITAAHIFFTREGRPRSDCFFKNQAEDSIKIDLITGSGRAAFGAIPPKAGSNEDFAIVTLAEPVQGATPFPVEDRVPIARGDRLIVITAHPAGMAKKVDNNVPVAQGCTVRRVPVSTAATSFYRTDCDASGSSSGGMHLARVGGRLVFRGITVTAGPWQDPRFYGAPYSEKSGSVTTALGTDAAVLRAGRYLAEHDP
jgi:Trypsin-like peptidase domain